MSLLQKSGPAKLMYTVIVITLFLCITCFGLYYGSSIQSTTILWIGITAFTICYHFWMRIIMGNVSKLFQKHIHYQQWWFQERAFEKKLYETLQVKKWKDKAPTYNPESFSLKKHSLEEIANTMAKSEVDHWINELISLSTLLFAIPWGAFGVFLVTALAAMVFDSQFIILQRYNRPRVVRVLNRQQKI